MDGKKPGTGSVLRADVGTGTATDTNRGIDFHLLFLFAPHEGGTSEGVQTNLAADAVLCNFHAREKGLEHSL